MYLRLCCGWDEYWSQQSFFTLLFRPPSAFFLIALFLCSSGLVVGAVGSLFLLYWRLKKSQKRKIVCGKELCNKSQ